MKKLIALLFCLGLISTTASAASVEGLVSTLSQQSGLTQDQAREQVGGVFTALSAELQAGREVTVKNFGKFYLQEREARKGRNPRTGEELQIPKKKYPKFSSSDTLKKMVN